MILNQEGISTQQFRKHNTVLSYCWYIDIGLKMKEKREWNTHQRLMLFMPLTTICCRLCRQVDAGGCDTHQGEFLHHQLVPGKRIKRAIRNVELSIKSGSYIETFGFTLGPLACNCNDFNIPFWKINHFLPPWIKHHSIRRENRVNGRIFYSLKDALK